MFLSEPTAALFFRVWRTAVATAIALSDSARTWASAAALPAHTSSSVAERSSRKYWRTPGRFKYVRAVGRQPCLIDWRLPVIDALMKQVLDEDFHLRRHDWLAVSRWRFPHGIALRLLRIERDDVRRRRRRLRRIEPHRINVRKVRCSLALRRSFVMPRLAFEAGPCGRNRQLVAHHPRSRFGSLARMDLASGSSTSAKRRPAT